MVPLAALLLGLGSIPQRVERVEVEVAQGDAPLGRLPLDAARTGAGTWRWPRAARPRPRSPCRRATLTSTNSRSPNSSARLGVVGARPRAARPAPRRPCRATPSIVRPVVAEVRPPAPASPGWPRGRASTRLIPSSALFGRRPSVRRRRPPRAAARPLVGLDPLPLAVDVGRGPRPRRRRTRAGGGGRSSSASAAWTSARSKTPASAASWAWRTTCSSRSPSSSASSGGRAALERVVDLVGLLEQVLAQRGVGLLAVPRAAVGLAQPVARSRASPRARRRPARARPARGRAAPARSRGVELADGRRPRPPRTGRPDDPPGRAGGGRRAGRRRRAVPPGQGSARGAGARRVAGAARRAARAGTISSGRDGSIGVADEPLGGDHLDARAPDRAPSAAAPRRRARRARGAR